MSVTEGKYSVKKDEKGKYRVSPELEKVVQESAQMTGGVSKVGNAALRTASKLRALSNKEAAFYRAGRDASKSMRDKKIMDKLIAARAKLLGL